MAAKLKVLVQLQLRNELDVILAQKRARDCAQLAGFTLPVQTKFATAVSEISRNVVDHVGLGDLSFNLREMENALWLEALASDRGRGIPDLEFALREGSRNQRGRGIYNSKQLVDDFEITTSAEQGTRVVLRQRITDRHISFSDDLVKRWQQQLLKEAPISPYEELKQQNSQLISLLDELKEKNEMAALQIGVISRLNLELEKLNAHNQTLLAEREERNSLLVNINTELEAFAHTVSHDLKSPLLNIKGLAHLVEESIKENDLADASNSLEMLQRQASWMDNMIRGILSYAKAGRFQLSKVEVNAGALLQNVVDALRVPDGIQIHIAPDLPHLLTEEIYLQQIFSNLVGNAIKYHDLPQGNVWVSALIDEGVSLTFMVADDGPGIDTDDQLNLFEIFQVFGSRLTLESTGVGLAIVKKIISDKGCKVWVESSGRGSRFYFTWPVRELITTPQQPALILE